MSLFLNISCWLHGESYPSALTLSVTPTTTVSDLKDIIKSRGYFKSADVLSLSIWKVIASEDEASRLTVGGFLEPPLPSKLKIGDRWTLEEVQENEVNAFVTTVFGRGQSLVATKRKKEDEVAEEEEIGSDARHSHSQEMAVRLGRNLTPSSSAGSKRVKELYGGPVTLFNGRGGQLGPPIALYHKVFETFRRRAADSVMITEQDNGTLNDLAFKSLDLYSNETKRTEAIMGPLNALLRGEANVEATGGTGRADLRWQTKASGGRNAYPVFAEIKKELGAGGTDPGVQGSLTYMACISQTPVVSTAVSLRAACCCPSFLISIAGPYFAILGMIFLERVVVEHLTPGYMYLGDKDTHKYLAILQECVADLGRWYEHTPLHEDRLRFFPRFNSYVDPSNNVVHLNYAGAPHHPNLPPIPRRRPVLFSSRIPQLDLVVKFTDSYGEVVHRLLEDEGLAPKLHFVSSEPITPNGPFMVVMDRVYGEDAQERFANSPLPDVFIRTIDAALKIVHDSGYVLGDLRRPNIMLAKVDERIAVQLIDFDWAGKAGEARYPQDLNLKIPWAEGVKGGGLITKAHDEWMRDGLKEGA